MGMMKFAGIVSAALLYAVLVAIYTLPAVFNLQTHIIGGHTDAFQFLWGTWWFNSSFGSGGNIWDCPMVLHPFGADLVQHDYPALANFISYLGGAAGLTLAGAYNLSLMFALWMNAVSAFLLARFVVKEWLPSFASGIVFAFATFFWAKLEGHYSFVHAYPMVLFVLSLHSAEEKGSLRWSFAAGLSFVAAAYCQYYYGIYLAAYFILFCFYRKFSLGISVTFSGKRRLVVAAILAVIGIVFAVLSVAAALNAPEGIEILNVNVRKNNVVMILWWVFWLAAFLVVFRPSLSAVPKGFTFFTRERVKMFLAACIPLLLLTPLVVKGLSVIAAGDFAAQTVSWKSGPLGAYPYTALLPNIYNFVLGDWLRRVLAPFEYFESGINCLGLVSISVVALTGMWKVAQWWRFAFVSFFVMSLGPFLRIWPGLEHGIILPFWFVRYLPVVNGARMPSRWIALALIVWAVIVALGMQRIKTGRLRFIAILLIALESFSAPIGMMDVEVPQVFKVVGADKSEGAVLELPFGVHDGRHGWGYNYQGEQLFYQTVHNKAIMGGYLSRIPDRIFISYANDETLARLVSLQEGGYDGGLGRGGFRQWLKSNGVTWVVLDKRAAAAQLTNGIIELLGEPSYSDGRYLAWRSPVLP